MTRPVAYIPLNFDYTMRAWDHVAEEPWIQKAQVIAQIAVFPLLLIAACEAVFKNGLFLVANLGIGTIHLLRKNDRPRH